MFENPWLATAGRLLNMRPMPQTVCQSNGIRTTAKVRMAPASLPWCSTSLSNASPDWYAASWCQRCPSVHTPSGAKAKSEPSRERMKSRAMIRTWGGTARPAWSLVMVSAMRRPTRVKHNRLSRQERAVEAVAGLCLVLAGELVRGGVVRIGHQEIEVAAGVAVVPVGERDEGEERGVRY